MVSISIQGVLCEIGLYTRSALLHILVSSVDICDEHTSQRIVYT